MYDIHCHILPGLDDGSASMSDSIKMAISAIQGGTTSIICTPHVSSDKPYDTENIRSVRDSLSETLETGGLPLKLHTGQEIMVCENYREIPSMLKSGKLLTLAHSGYVLIEFPLNTDFSIIEKTTAHIVSKGYVPIIAHPERYEASRDRVCIPILKSQGALIQVNKGSLKGSFGHSVQENAHFILQHRLADFVASDAHSPTRRTPALNNVYDAIVGMYSADYADRLINRNPQKILRNIKINPDKYRE